MSVLQSEIKLFFNFHQAGRISKLLKKLFSVILKRTELCPSIKSVKLIRTSGERLSRRVCVSAVSAECREDVTGCLRYDKRARCHRRECA